jgi:hypothetical protein
MRQNMGMSQNVTTFHMPAYQKKNKMLLQPTLTFKKGTLDDEEGKIMP